MRNPRGEASRARTGRCSARVGEPGAVAADEVGDVGEAVGGEGGRGDRGPVAARAVDDRRAGGVEVVEVVEELGQRDVAGAWEGAGDLDLGGVANIDDLEVGVVR